jgi:hypothetical protein
MNDTTNARIRQLADGITAEMIAEQTHLFYEPQTGGGTIAFQSRESLFLNGAYQPLSGNFDILSVGIPDIAGRCFGSGVDPVTGADLANVSAAGIALIIKAAYDVLYNERAALRAREADLPVA